MTRQCSWDRASPWGAFAGIHDLLGGVVGCSEPAYPAKLRNNEAAITAYGGQGITVCGFDIAHHGPKAEALVVHIQDLIGDSGGVNPTRNDTDGRSADGSGDIGLAFERTVQRYGGPAAGRPAAGPARAEQSPATDILGQRRSRSTTIGAVAFRRVSP